MITTNYENLLRDLYFLYSEDGQDIIRNVEFIFDDVIDCDFLEYHANLMVSELEAKITYLQRHYKYELIEGTYYFKKGCLKSFNPETGLIFRNKSEWFRKMPTDLYFIQLITGCKKFKVTVPELWIRSQELPTMVQWSLEKNILIYDRHVEKAKELLEKNPLEKVIQNYHSITRRYFIRYYYLIGQMTSEQYKKHKSKTTKQMKENSELLKL